MTDRTGVDMTDGTCSIAGCESRTCARGWCAAHYKRWQRHGDPLAGEPVRDLSLSDADRFWAKVDTSAGPRGCWLWTAALHEYGYGIFGYKGRMRTAHRLIMEVVTGEPLGKQQVDHRYTCPKNCVNPMHLRLVTNKQNAENRAGAQSNNKTGIRGVSKQTNCSTYMAQVTHNGTLHYCGSYETPEEAGEAARLKRLELHTHNDMDRP